MPSPDRRRIWRPRPACGAWPAPGRPHARRCRSGPSSACASSRPAPAPRAWRRRSCAAAPRSACCRAPSRRASADADAPAASGGGRCGPAARARRRWPVRSSPGLRAARSRARCRRSTSRRGSGSRPPSASRRRPRRHRTPCTSIAGRSAVIAAFTRRLPTTIVSPSSFGVTQGGWMMPTALIEATQLLVHRRRHRRAAGIVRIGLESTGIDAAKFGHGWLLWLGFHPPCASGRPLPRAASRPGGARACAAGSAQRDAPLRRRTAMRQPSPAFAFSPFPLCSLHFAA